jgi:Uma2 family endonuclease
MSSVIAEPHTEWLPNRPLTRADLETLPDDGHRYELIDGVLVVSPAPSWQHQAAVVELLVRLRDACPPELKVFVAPLDVSYTENTVLQPDVLVASRADLGERNLEGVPRLAAEVLSPSTRHLDLAFKRARYEAAGCPSYWVIDPSVPSIVCWELADGTYREVGRATDDEQVMLTKPFPVTISPADLVD